MAEGIVMVQSINTKVDLVIEGTSHMGLTDYGKIMIGDKGFEFFNDRDVRKNIQIPWTEVDLVIASVMFKGAGFRVTASRRRKTERLRFRPNSRERSCVPSGNILHLSAWFAR